VHYNVNVNIKTNSQMLSLNIHTRARSWLKEVRVWTYSSTSLPLLFLSPHKFHLPPLPHSAAVPTSLLPLTQPARGLAERSKLPSWVWCRAWTLAANVCVVFWAQKTRLVATKLFLCMTVVRKMQAKKVPVWHTGPYRPTSSTDPQIPAMILG